jgi:hypothetical protein
MPPWDGTPWDFNGTTQVPGEGFIACGYYVSTLLRDAGFRVERIRLAQQASEYIVRTVAPSTEIKWFRRKSVDTVVDHVAAQPDGLWVVGLDFHVAFLVARLGQVQMCHASYLDEAVATCEPARTAEAMVSKVHVVGRTLGDPQLIAWLEGTRIETRTP